MMSGRSCVAHFHPQAALDLESIRDKKERTSVHRVVEMLSRNGHRMTAPHARHITGTNGLRELRPKSGKSKWRPLYISVDDFMFVVLLIAPESRTDGNGFRRAVERARDLALDAYNVEV